MPVIKIEKHVCDVCGQQYNPDSVAVSETSGDRVTALRIDGYYKPEKQAVMRCICLHCSNKILQCIRQLKVK